MGSETLVKQSACNFANFFTISEEEATYPILYPVIECDFEND